jgi:hypothetical protein
VHSSCTLAEKLISFLQEGSRKLCKINLIFQANGAARLGRPPPQLSHNLIRAQIDRFAFEGDASDPVALSKKMMGREIRNVGSVLLLDRLDAAQNFRIKIH